MRTILSEIFSEIITGYNKLLETTVSKIDASKDTARDRLKLVLMHDRTKLSPEMMAKMRDELVEVISRYVEIDKEALDLNLASEGNSIALMASIPVMRAKEESSSDETETVEETEEVKEDEVSENPIAKESKKTKKSKKKETSEAEVEA